MTNDPYPTKSEPAFDYEAEDRFFVTLFRSPFSASQPPCHAS